MQILRFVYFFFQKHQFKKFTEFFNEDYSPVEQIEDMKEKLLEALSKQQNISRLSKINWRNHWWFPRNKSNSELVHVHENASSGLLKTSFNKFPNVKDEFGLKTWQKTNKSSKPAI